MEEQTSLPASAATATPPPPVPLSTYSTYKPQTFQPTCTHLTMTRVYEPAFKCSLCHRPGHFDYLGNALGKEIRPGLRSPERRASKLSFFEEVTPEQMKTYSPSQVATILQQRENLLNLVSQQHQDAGNTPPLYLPSGRHGRNVLKPPPGLLYMVPTDIKPWIPRKDEECQAKYCHTCRPSCELRSYLSIDSIMHGEIPPTVATGYGFHRMKTRPVVDVEVIRAIGLRPVPWRRVHSHGYASSPSSQSTWTLSDIMEDQLIELEVELEDSDSGEGSAIDSARSTRSHTNAFEQQRPAFTPPSTSICWTGIARQENGTMGFEHCPFVCDGRSPESLKTNDEVRRQVVGSIAGLMERELDEYDVEEFDSICSFTPTKQSMKSEANLPSRSPLKSAKDISRGEITLMMKEELEEGRFHHDPLDVGDGIAVLEESIELGVPDVIAKK
ncbi:hypothetical protein F5Y08DRAFT_325541 [Xylaria arbuscula]|nr:hypothetical protein F5Y08DRAFT_325541 [Xylaria arbuscula]